MAYNLQATADAVRAGMEVLLWQVEERHWHEVGIAEAASDSRKTHARVLGGFAALATVPIVVAIAIALWGDDFVGPGFLINILLMPVAFAAVYASVRALVERTLGPELPVVPLPPRVIFTSTGLTVGGHAWLWRAPRYRLARATLHDENPTQLRLEFRGTGLLRPLVAETLEIPFPTDLEDDLSELTEMLAIKTRLGD